MKKAGFSMPYVNTRPGANAPNAATRGSSALTTAVDSCPFNPSISSRLASAISSTEKKNSRCAGETRVTTPTSGRAIAARRRSSPRRDIPISSTAAWSVSSSRNSVNGSPYSLFKFPSDFRTRSFAPNSAARISFVVVLPTEPVTPAIFPPHDLRTARASCLSASKVSPTAMHRSRTGPAYRGSCPSATTAALAPPSSAPATWSCPSSATSLLALRPFKSTLAQGAPCHIAIVKFERSVGENLIILMALSGQQHDVSVSGFLHGHADRLFPVRLDQIFAGGFLQPHNDIADDFQRVLAAGIVARKNRQVAQPAGDFPHHRPLGSVFFAAASEERDDSALGIQLARRSNQVFQCIVGVRIIDNHQKRLAQVDPLETPRDALEVADSVPNHFV